MIWLLGLFFLIFGLFLILTAFLARERDYVENSQFTEIGSVAEEEKKYGGLVLIGPIPIVFGDARLAITALVLTIILMFLMLLMVFRW